MSKWKTMVPGQVWHHYPAGEPFRFLVVTRESEVFGWSYRGGQPDADGAYSALARGFEITLAKAKRAALEASTS